MVSGRTLLGMEKLVGWKLVNCCFSVCSDYTSSSFPYAIVVVTDRTRITGVLVLGLLS